MQRLPEAAPSSTCPSASTSSRHDAEEGPAGRARLHVVGAGQGGDHDPAGLGLPPGVDDRAAARRRPRRQYQSQASGLIGSPTAAEQADRRAVVLLHRRLALAHQRADRGRRGVEDVDLVALDHVPEAARNPGSWARLRTSGWSRRWRAGRRRRSYGRSPSRRRRCTRRSRRACSRTHNGRWSRSTPHSRRWCGARPWACRSSPTCRG